MKILPINNNNRPNFDAKLKISGLFGIIPRNSIWVTGEGKQRKITQQDLFKKAKKKQTKKGKGNTLLIIVLIIGKSKM